MPDTLPSNMENYKSVAFKWATFIWAALMSVISTLASILWPVLKSLALKLLNFASASFQSAKLKLASLNRETLTYHSVRIFIAGIFVVPLLWVFSASLRQPGLPPSRTIEWIPNPVSWSNYERIFEIIPLFTYILNSLLVASIAVPLTVITASWAGLAMANLPGQARNRLVIFSVLLLMVPITALWLTRFIIFRYLGIVDTVWALVAPAVMGSSPLFVLLYYWTFRRLPTELFQAAKLDGAGAFQFWLRIAMPAAKATTAAVVVLSFAFYWSDFISPLIYLKSEKLYTLPVGVQMLQQLDSTNWPLLMAAATAMSVPIILLFCWIQRYFWQTAK